jgi:UDP:flavonoid glycosyltransferase YjiC (YdhE family)
MDKAKKEEKKIVFIGFGSIIIPDPVAMTRVISEAVEKAGVYAIVAKGWSDRAGSKDDSEEEKKKSEEKEKEQHELLDRPFIYNVKSIPHDWLFSRIDAAVHHGGAGTTGASLRGKSQPFFFSSLFRIACETQNKS